MESKEERPSSRPTAQAVVLGCSHNNGTCTHDMHPSRDDFFTIDIREDIAPDLCMDITRDQIPEPLKKQFKLTILEYMPYDTYNHAKGLANIREMTDDNGLILVVGNPRDFHFRHSLSALNYLELAVDDDGTYVLAIPNNQHLSVAQVAKQLADLPEPLQRSIEEAKKGYHPLNPAEYCKLNYQESKHNKALIRDLSHYISSRAYGTKYTTSLSLFGGTFNFGHSRDEKIKAANALIQVLLGNKPVNSLAEHAGSLSNGSLGAIVNNHLKGQSLVHLIDSPLMRRAEKGEEFFYPPNSTGHACLSCGDGRVYKGTLVEIHHQLQAALNKDPENEKLSRGLAVISRELLAHPSLARSEERSADSAKKPPSEDNPLSPIMP